MANPRAALGSGAGGPAGERQKPAFALCMPLKNGRLISKFRVASPAGRASGESLMLCLWVAAAQCCRPFEPSLPIANWRLYLIVGSLMVANTTNILSDVSAMGDALVLLVMGMPPCSA